MQVIKNFSNRYGYFLFYLLVAILIKLLEIGEQLNNKILLTNTLDFSWKTDMVERLYHDFLAGRDFIFTYGPFSQIIFSTPGLILGLSSYISVIYADLLLTVLNIVFIFIIVNFITDNLKDRIILSGLLIFVLGLIAYDANTLFRILVPFFYGLLLYKTLNSEIKFSQKKVLIFTLPVIFGFYTFDLLITLIILTVIFISFKIITNHRIRHNARHIKKYLLFGLIQLAAISTFAFLGSFILSENLNYLIYSYDTVKNYQFVMNIPFSINNTSVLLVFPLGIFLMLIYLFKKTNLKKEMKILLVFLSLISLLQLKSAFIRSDDGHVIMGLYPSIIVFFIISYFILRERFNILIFISAVVLYLLIPYKPEVFNIFSYFNLKTGIVAAAEKKEFLDIYKFPDNYHFNPQDFNYFKKLIEANPGQVMVYPYENYLLNMYGQTFNTLPLQFYQYSNSITEKDSVGMLAIKPPLFVILGIDDISAVKLDDIPNFTRNPLTAKWMFENYDVYKKTDSYLVLTYKANKQISSTLNASCNVFEFIPERIVRVSFADNFLKPSIYYLNNPNIRIPFSYTNNNFLIIENYNDIDSVDELFRNYSVNDNNKAGLKELNITKYNPFTTKRLTFDKQFNVECLL